MKRKMLASLAAISVSASNACAQAPQTWRQGEGLETGTVYSISAERIALTRRDGTVVAIPLLPTLKLYMTMSAPPALIAPGYYVASYTIPHADFFDVWKELHVFSPAIDPTWIDHTVDTTRRQMTMKGKIIATADADGNRKVSIRLLYFKGRPIQRDMQQEMQVPLSGSIIYVEPSDAVTVRLIHPGIKLSVYTSFGREGQTAEQVITVAKAEMQTANIPNH